MKNSHIAAPRTLADAHFQCWADPIERPESESSLPRWLYALTLGVVLCAALAAVFWR